MSDKVKQIIVAVVIIVIAFFAIKYFFGDSTIDSGTTTAQTPQVDLVNGQEIVTMLNRLNNVKIDEKIFTHPVFVSLEDFGRPIDSENVGRPNPFAPIGADGTTVTSRPTSTSTAPRR